MKRDSLLEEQIVEKIATRKRPVKREKQRTSIFAILGILLFLISLIVTIILQMQ